MGLGLVLRCCRVLRWGAGGAGTDSRLMASLVLLLDRVGADGCRWCFNGSLGLLRTCSLVMRYDYR